MPFSLRTVYFIFKKIFFYISHLTSHISKTITLTLYHLYHQPFTPLPVQHNNGTGKHHHAHQDKLHTPDFPSSSSVLYIQHCFCSEKGWTLWHGKNVGSSNTSIYDRVYGFRCMLVTIQTCQETCGGVHGRRRCRGHNTKFHTRGMERTLLMVW